jgi:4-hydroxybenzoate polyprenyltransferase
MVKAWLQLVRLPNLFTAMADIVAGTVVAAGALRLTSHLAFGMLASSLLYAGGVALNDVFDFEQDARERPHRPVPSGRIGRRNAAAIALTLLVAGWLAASLVSLQSAWVAATVVIAIVLYDSAAKRTAAGPAVMGLCRALNLLLGMTAGGMAISSEIPLVAVFVLLAAWAYVTGVTWFARKEAGRPRAEELLPGLVLAAAGVGLTIGMPLVFETRHHSYVVLPLALLVLVIVQGLSAVRTLNSTAVQRAVRVMVFGLVVLDAGLAWFAGGPVAGAATLAFLVPTLLAGRWIYST